MEEGEESWAEVEPKCVFLYVCVCDFLLCGQDGFARRLFGL